MSSFDMYIATLTMDLSVSIIDDDHELNKILESTNSDEYELIDLPMKQSGGLSHKHAGVGMASTLDVHVRWGWHHLREVQRYCFRDLTLASSVLSVFPSIPL